MAHNNQRKPHHRSGHKKGGGKKNFQGNRRQVYEFKYGDNVGAPDAESDKVLMNLFIPSDVLSVVSSVESQKSVLIGRTGMGKSAILKYIEVHEDNVARIDPEEMSLRYLSNSTVLSYFRKLNVNLNFFYKVLWKHVFIVELLKLHFGPNMKNKDQVIDSLVGLVNKNRRQKTAKLDKAIKYLKEWSDDFWAETEHRIMSLEKEIESQFLAETGWGLPELSMKSTGSLRDKQKVIEELKHKAEKIINNSQANEIHEIYNIMKDVIFCDTQKSYYVIIDDLDKGWIDTEIRYTLIGAMIEVIKEFQAMQRAKIIISLRDNLHQLVLAGYARRGGQREKFKPLYATLTWSDASLKLFANGRVSDLTKKLKNIDTIFERRSKGGTHYNFDYLLQRTFMRPRDLLSFLNHILEHSVGDHYFKADNILKAEKHYSRDRLIALEDEWGENFGNIHDICKLIEGKPVSFKMEDIEEEEFLETLCNIDDLMNVFQGEFLQKVNSFSDGKLKFIEFRKYVFYTLYKIGVLGIKVNARHKKQFYYDEKILITESEIEDESKFYVHYAFWSCLKIDTRNT